MKTVITYGITLLCMVYRVIITRQYLPIEPPDISAKYTNDVCLTTPLSKSNSPSLQTVAHIPSVPRPAGEDHVESDGNG